MTLSPDDIEWSTLSHAYGPATDVPDMLRALQDAAWSATTSAPSSAKKAASAGLAGVAGSVASLARNMAAGGVAV